MSEDNELNVELCGRPSVVVPVVIKVEEEDVRFRLARRRKMFPPWSAPNTRHAFQSSS